VVQVTELISTRSPGSHLQYDKRKGKKKHKEALLPRLAVTALCPTQGKGWVGTTLSLSHHGWPISTALDSISR
jgi:hypothetical protein